ncbi:MAG: oligosaccharide flippase family protein [Verrucomicrobiota bacterium]
MKPGEASDGRERLTTGLLVSWLSQILLILSGFIVPRMIDDAMGAATLGIWDFGWSMVSYFGLIEGGIGSSVNRYVAVERGKGDQEGVNRIASSAALIQRAVGSVVILLTIGLAWCIPYNLKDVGPELELQARWLVMLLGTATGLTMFGAVFTGILTGCHRWATHHSIYAITNILSVVAMVIALGLGFGIITLGVIQLCRELLGRSLRVIYAYKACDGLRISMRLADKSTIRSMLGFGGRMAIGRISRILLAQTSSILVMSFLGPAQLAMFVRPRSLVRQTSVFPQKFSFMLVPTVAAMVAADKTREVREFVIKSSRTGLYMSAPLIALLAIGGPDLIHLWMGPDYANPWLIGLLTMALASEVFYQPLDSLLIGLNLHGKPALVMLGAALAGIIGSWVALSSGFGLIGVAVAIGIPWTFAHGVYLPLFTCKKLQIPPTEFFRSVWLGPLVATLPFAGFLVAGRVIFPDRPIEALASGGLAGGAVLGVFYWCRVLPDSMKRKLISILAMRPNKGSI